MTKEQIKEIQRRVVIRDGLQFVELSARERDALCDMALRYAWLRSSGDLDGPHVYGPDDDCIIDGDDLDAAIDAERSRQ